MFHRVILVAGLSLLFFVLVGGSAEAARVVQFEILHDDKIVLHVRLLDQGEADFDAAWNYLKTRPLKNPVDTFLHSREETERLKAFRIEPSKEDPLKATLQGNYRIFCRYAGDIKCDELRLVRKDENSPWFIDPKQVDELADKRTIDPARRTRAQVDAATKNSK